MAEKNKTTALLLCSWFGKVNLMKMLLQDGVSANVVDRQKRSALHFASYAGHAECVELLILYGADVNSWEQKKGVTPLHCAASMGHLNCLRILIQHGSRVNEGLEKRSPLHYAVQNLASDCIKELLENGAIPNTPQVYSETPLHVASTLGNSSAIKLLLQYGAAVNVQSGREKLTPLHLASEQGDVESTRLLIEAGAALNSINAKHQTPLHLAALSQCSETLNLLLTKGANPNAPDIDGRTPLHCSTVNVQRSCECVRLLLSAGADPNRSDIFGYTPMHLAALNEFSNCIILFLQYGGDVTAKTKGGVTVLNFIIKKTPEVIPKYIARFDNSIRLNEHDLGDVDCQLKLDLRILVPRMGNQETSLLVNFIEVGHKEILQHPLCETFLHLKWRQIRKFFTFSLVYHALFVVLFSAYIIGVYLKFCPSFRKANVVSACDAGDEVILVGYLVLFLNTLLLFKECFQILHSWRVYVREWENWLQWAIIVSVYCCVQPLYQMNIREYVYTWQHHVAAIGIFLAWVELMMNVGRFPTFGLYIQMFTRVSINFSKFMLAYFCLFIAFSLSFGVIFPNYPAFKDLKWVLIKVIIMMSGELEYEDVLFGNVEVKYPYTAHLAYLIFVLLVTVILTNLLVGLAVSDIQGLQKTADLERLVRQATLIAHLESMLFSKLLRWVPPKVMLILHKNALLLKSQRDFTLDIRPNDPREDKLPKHLIEGAYGLVLSRKDRSKRKSLKKYVYSPPSSRASIRRYGSLKKEYKFRDDQESGFGSK
ncbi:transient receptor potential channel pyrexia isoform X2 [Cylas formicarius]|nr:transient receptor potential channel pyrexia isoform X2 [Cylas formicarius]